MGTIIEKKADTEQEKVRRLPLGIKLSFGIGDISNNIFIVTTGMYLLFFMTNVLSVSTPFYLDQYLGELFRCGIPVIERLSRFIKRIYLGNQVHKGLLPLC